MLLNGRAVDKDETEAVKWLAKPAENGQANAQFNRGMGYASGIGVKQDYVQAHKWLGLAASQGQTNAAAIAALEKLMKRDQLKGPPRLAREFKWPAR
jgi:TPR repeat protein